MKTKHVKTEMSVYRTIIELWQRRHFKENWNKKDTYLQSERDSISFCGTYLPGASPRNDAYVRTYEMQRVKRRILAVIPSVCEAALGACGIEDRAIEDRDGTQPIQQQPILYSDNCLRLYYFITSFRSPKSFAFFLCEGPRRSTVII